jgi:hypothetical protein
MYNLYSTETTKDVKRIMFNVAEAEYRTKLVLLKYRIEPDKFKRAASLLWRLVLNYYSPQKVKPTNLF